MAPLEARLTGNGAPKGRRIESLLALGSLVLAACGGSSGASTTTSPTGTTTSTTSTVVATSTSEAVAITVTDPDAQLAAAMDAVKLTDCFWRSPLGDIVHFGPDEPLFELMGGAAPDGVTRSGVPVFRHLDIDVVGFTTAGATDAGRLHAEIIFSQMRTLVVLAEINDQPGGPIVFSSVEAALAGNEDDRYALWDWRIGAIYYADSDDIYEFPRDLLRHWDSTLRFPEYQLGEEALTAAWTAVDDWLVALGEAVDIYRDAGPASVAAELEPLVADLDTTIARLCTIHATVGQRYEEDHTDRDSLLVRLATEELLLVTEYLGVIQDVMDDEGVEWLQADQANLTVADDGITSHAEHLRVWQHAIDFSLYLHGLYRSQPVVTNPPPDIPQLADIP